MVMPSDSIHFGGNGEGNFCSDKETVIDVGDFVCNLLMTGAFAIQEMGTEGGTETTTYNPASAPGGNGPGFAAGTTYALTSDAPAPAEPASFMLISTGLGCVAAGATRRVRRPLTRKVWRAN
jgi:hypothetical protein